MKVAAKTIEQLKAEAAAISRQSPGKPVVAYVVFQQAYVSVLNRITRNTPGDTTLGGYWMSGEFKPFSQKQLIQYQNTGLDCE